MFVCVRACCFGVDDLLLICMSILLMCFVSLFTCLVSCVVVFVCLFARAFYC